MASERPNLHATSEALIAYDKILRESEYTVLFDEDGVASRGSFTEALLKVDAAGQDVRRALLADSGIRWFGSRRLAKKLDLHSLRGVVQRWRDGEPLTWQDVEAVL